MFDSLDSFKKSLGSTSSSHLKEINVLSQKIEKDQVSFKEEVREIKKTLSNPHNQETTRENKHCEGQTLFSSDTLSKNMVEKCQCYEKISELQLEHELMSEVNDKI